MENIKEYKGRERVPETFPPSIPRLHLLLLFLKNLYPPPYFTLSLWKLFPSIWSNLGWNLIHLMSPSFDNLPRWSQSKPITYHSNLYLFHSQFFPYLSLVFGPFPSLYIFLHSSLFYLFPWWLKRWKTQEYFVWRRSFLNEEQNIIT